MPSSAPTRIAPMTALAACGLALSPAASLADERLFDQLDRNDDGRLVRSEILPEQRRLFDRLVRRSDENGDGALTKTEFAAGLTPDTPDKPIESAQPQDNRDADATRLLLLRLDTNRDTRLTRAEAPQELRLAFDRLVDSFDRNKDGELDLPELSRVGPKLSRTASRVARQLGWEVEREVQEVAAKQGDDANRFDRPFEPMRDLADPKKAAELFKRLDTNRDGQLVTDELPGPLQERMRPLLRRADTDRNGSLSQQEFVAASARLAELRGQPTPPRSSPGANESFAAESDAQRVAQRLVDRMVQRNDRNGDGVLSRDEAPRRIARRFNEADLNANGQLDPPELAALAQQIQSRLTAADRAAARRTGQPSARSESP